MGFYQFLNGYGFRDTVPRYVNVTLVCSKYMIIIFTSPWTNKQVDAGGDGIYRQHKKPTII